MQHVGYGRGRSHRSRCEPRDISLACVKRRRAEFSMPNSEVTSAKAKIDLGGHVRGAASTALLHAMRAAYGVYFRDNIGRLMSGRRDESLRLSRPWPALDMAPRHK